MKPNHHIHAFPCATSRARHTSSTRFLTKLLAASAAGLFALTLAAPNAANAQAPRPSAPRPSAPGPSARSKGALSQSSVPASVNRDNQDNVRRIPGFDIEFYKKLNPDDFAATDVPALRKLFQGIYRRDDGKLGNSDYRTFKLTLTEEPRLRRFEDLNAEEGAKGGTWYTGARWRVNLHEESLNNYLTVIVPKMQAVLSKMAVKTSEQDIVYKVTNGTEHRRFVGSVSADRTWLVLELESKVDWNPGAGKIRISFEIPENPQQLLNPKVGDRIPVKLVSYDLPAAFGSAIPDRANDSGMVVYRHISAKDGTYLATTRYSSSAFDEVNAGATYSSSAQHSFRFYCPSMGAGSLYENSIRVIQDEGQFPTFRLEVDNYGGCLLSFRKASDVFPEVKKEE